MPALSPTDPYLASPDYWGGYNITHDALFTDVPDRRGDYVSGREYARARGALAQGIGHVVLGDDVEICFREGVEFDPTIDDGSLMVLDTEMLTHWKFADPIRRLPENDEGDSSITSPYTAYWLNCMSERPDNFQIGTRQITFADGQTAYHRNLYWGVLCTNNGLRAIQTFEFNNVRLLDDDTVVLLDQRKLGKLVPLPIQIGTVEPKRQLEVKEGHVNVLRRLRSVDIVYPVANDLRKPRRVRSRLAHLALPHLGTRHVHA